MATQISTDLHPIPHDEERPGRIDILAVLFTDLCNSTRLYRDLGDAAAHALAAQSLTTMKNAVAHRGGNVVKTIGDGVMATFTTADAAYEAANEIQHSVDAGQLQVKIAFHIGPVICADTDVFGDTVNLAARVLARAGPGEILMTGACLNALRPEYRLTVRLLDTTGVKGRPEPVDIYCTFRDDQNATSIVPSSYAAERLWSVRFEYNGTELRINSSSAPILFGRDAACSIVVESEYASRRHAAVEVQRDRVVITDHSSNGTYVVSASGAQFLKREAATLTGSGVISLGRAADENQAYVIHYAFVQDPEAGSAR